MAQGSEYDDIAVGFLAGGQARRMGGGDKALITISGQTILSRQIEATAGHRVRMINANGDAGRFSRFGLPVIADTLDGYPGPLAGILACLSYLERCHPEIDCLLSCATDAPFIPADLAVQLGRACQQQKAQLAQASSYGRRHPVFGLWPVSVKTALHNALVEEGLRKIDDFTARYSVAVVDFDRSPDPFMNVNRPEDISYAEDHCRTGAL